MFSSRPFIRFWTETAVFLQMNDRSFYLLSQQLQQAAETPRTPLQKQYGTFYAACLNAEQANALGANPLRGLLAAISALTSKAQIALFLGNTRTLGAGLFTLTVTQDDKDATKQNLTVQQSGLTLPTPEYYLKPDAQQAATLLSCKQYLVTVFQQLGDQPAQAATEAQSVLEVETALARGSMSRGEVRDPSKTYHPVSLAKLARLTPNFDWPAYLKGLDAPAFTVIDVQRPASMETVAKVIAAEPLAALKSYLRIHTVDPVAPYLSAPFEQASFQFFGMFLRGQQTEQPR